MRLILWILVLFAAAVGLAVSAHYNPGNVVLFYPPYRIDLSLNLFLLLLIFGFAVIYAVIRVFRNARKMPGRVSAYRQKKRENEANNALREAFKALQEGRFVQAERAADRAAELPENVGCAAIIGARAAHAMHQFDRRDAWLARTENVAAFKAARLMTRIELLIEDHQTKAAIEAINELKESGARHIHAKRLALKAHQQARNWDEVLRLVRSLDNHHAIHPALSMRLRELAYEDLLSSHSRDGESLRRIWQKIPAADRYRPFVAVRAANAFNAAGLHDEARALIARALSANWDERLLRSYRQSAAAEGTPALLAQIEQCESWAQRRPADPELELTLGTLCLKQKLWGKAKRHLEQSLAGAADQPFLQEAHLRLAQLHEALNQPQEAALHYRQSALASES